MSKNDRIKWDDFVREAAKLTGVTQATIKEGWSAISIALANLYRRKEAEISMPNFAKVNISYMPPKEAVSNLTGEKVIMGDKFKVKITPYQSLLKAVNAEDEELEL